MEYRFDSKNHLHTLDGVALTGTSSVVQILSKPLSYWASGKAVEMLGWSNPKKFTKAERQETAKTFWEEIKSLDLVSYIERLDKAYHNHAKSLKESAKSGTDLHSELEMFVKSEMGLLLGTLLYSSKIKPFMDWAKENVKQFLWSEAHCYDEELLVGGISDAGCELNDGTYAVIDFKSSKEAYPSHFLQDAGYAIQINKNGLWSENGMKNKKLDKPIEALIVVPFGASVVKPEIRYDVKVYEDGFRQAVGLYRLLGYDQKIKEN